jgi:hypothetical protein
LLCPPYSSDLSAIRSPERALKRIIFHNPLPTTRYIGPTGNHAHVLNSMPHVRGTKVKITASWDVTPCSLVEANRRFRDEYCLLSTADDGGSTHSTSTRPHDDGGGTHLWNVGQLIRHYTALHSRKLSSLYSPPWEPEIS